MKINVIGGGAIGLLLAAKLGRFHDVRLLTRTRHQSKRIAAEGLRIGQEVIAVTASAFEDLQESTEADAWIICVKQYDLTEIWDKVKLHARSAVVFLQNGMGHTDMLRKVDVDYPIIVGSVEHGALRMDPRTVEHTGEAVIRLADLSGGHAFELVGRLHEADFPFIYERDWYKMLGTKLIANAVINPLTAIYRIENGELLERQPFEHIARMLCKEAAETLGFDRKEQWENVRRIIQATKANRSSMYKDIQAGAFTEIEAISGYIRKHAKHDVPYTDFVYHSIHGLTKTAGED